MARHNKDKKEDGKYDNAYDDSDWEAKTAKPISDEVIREEVKPKTAEVVVKNQIRYNISGLSDRLRVEALNMLADGIDIKVVADKYGVAPSDISILS